MAKSNFENLKVHRLSEELADAVWAVVEGWDRFAMDSVGKRLARAADSVGANIAEGVGRGTTADNKRFVRTARGSLYEVRHWLRRAFRGLLSESQIGEIKPIVDELSPRLNAYLKSIGRFEKEQ